MNRSNSMTIRAATAHRLYCAGRRFAMRSGGLKAALALVFCAVLAYGALSAAPAAAQIPNSTNTNSNSGGNDAGANCITGLPCIVDKTVNADHFDDIIDPNVSGPNKDKIDNSRTCNADFMNQIYARAYLEAERESLMLQTIIRKPDSVMEYSCFENIVNVTAKHAPPIFSETKRWSTKHDGDRATVELSGSDSDDVAQIDNEDIDDMELEVYIATDEDGNDLPEDETRLGNHLEPMVLATFLSYLEGHFPYEFLTGSPSGLNDDTTGEVELADRFDCDLMRNVWRMVKCADFETDDRMLTFDSLVGLDPRIYPQSCTAERETSEHAESSGESGSGSDADSSDSDPHGITRDRIRLAKNDYRNFTYSEREPLSSVDDPFRTTSCGAPIPTGLTVRVYRFTTGLLGRVTTTHSDHEEHICANPGCYYNGSRCTR